MQAARDIGPENAGLIRRGDQILIRGKRRALLRIVMMSHLIHHRAQLGVYLRLLERYDITPEETAFVGDDFPDHPVLRVVGLPVAVANAVPEIRALCSVQLTRTGGNAAVREFAEMLLKARGDWERVVSDYLVERIDTKLEVLR